MNDRIMPPAPMFVTTTRATPIPFLASETVIFRVRRSILFLLIPILLVTSIGAALFLVITSLNLPSGLVSGLRIGLIIAVAFIDLIIFLDWLSTIYILTSRRIQSRFGIVGEQTKTIALEQITDTRVVIGILGRIFNYGDVRIEAANINSIITFHGISSPGDRLNQINDAQLQIQ